MAGKKKKPQPIKKKDEITWEELKAIEVEWLQKEKTTKKK